MQRGNRYAASDIRRYRQLPIGHRYAVTPTRGYSYAGYSYARLLPSAGLH